MIVLEKRSNWHIGASPSSRQRSVQYLSRRRLIEVAAVMMEP
jgi:hypothetical protein